MSCWQKLSRPIRRRWWYSTAAGAVEMGPWLAKAPALVYTWYGGLGGRQCAGPRSVWRRGRLRQAALHIPEAVAGFARSCPECRRNAPSRAKRHLSGHWRSNSTVTYAEGLLVGYRWFDAKQIEPLFPFGYGLSYTKFAYSGLQLVQGGDPANPSVTVEFDVTNAGAREARRYRRSMSSRKTRACPVRPRNSRASPRSSLQAGAKAESVHPPRIATRLPFMIRTKKDGLRKKAVSKSWLALPRARFS